MLKNGTKDGKEALEKKKRLKAEKKRKAYSRRYLRTLVSTLLILLAVIGVAYVAATRYLPIFHVYSTSMGFTVRQGDIVLDRTLTYEVDQTLTVEPEDTSALLIKKGEDLCTLVTCTPYGINTHRLLVRGHRVETPEDEKIFRISADAEQVDELIVAAVLAAVLLLIVLPIVSASDHIRMKKRKGKA